MMLHALCVDNMAEYKDAHTNVAFIVKSLMK